MIEYDPADPRWVVDPGPLCDELREQNPLHRTSENYWVLTRHADVLALLRDHAASADSLNIHDDKQPGRFASEDSKTLRAMIRETGEDNRPFLVRDPPDHTRLRGLVQRAFTPKRVAELAPFIRETTAAVIDQHLDGTAFDAVQELAWPVPVAVIGRLLGVPTEDQLAFQVQSGLIARGLDPEFLMDEPTRRARDEAGLFFIDYFSRQFADRRQRPGDDLLSALVAARDGEDRLTEGELLSTAILLLIAGHETTMNLISGSLLLLSRDPEAQQRLREGGVTRPAVDDLLRLVSPVQLTARSLVSDVTVGGVTLEAGSFVLALLAAANRDPAAFSDPTRLTLDRDPNSQLGFGFGLHHCLGAPLARLEAQLVLEEVLARTTEVRVVGDIRYRPNIVLRGLAALDVEFAA